MIPTLNGLNSWAPFPPFLIGPLWWWVLVVVQHGSSGQQEDGHGAENGPVECTMSTTKLVRPFFLVAATQMPQLHYLYSSIIAPVDSSTAPVCRLFTGIQLPTKNGKSSASTGIQYSNTHIHVYYSSRVYALYIYICIYSSTTERNRLLRCCGVSSFCFVHGLY